tara:strand:+ start:551 stop:769 length:219 start_codon:yes stop_codon:yes gene_type:complete
MSKVKQMAWNNAEKEVDKITNDYLEGNIDLNTAENKISEVDNVELVVEKHNIGDHLYYAKNDYDAKMMSKYY